MDLPEPIFFSIVLPSFNEERYIETTLKSLLALNFPRESYEIIVVDNGSTDNTVKIAQAYADKVFVVPGVRVGAVRNYGVKQSRGNVVAFLDSDCVPPRDWLNNALEYMTKNNCDVVGGVYLLRQDPSWVESAWVVSPDLRDRPTKILVGGSIIIPRTIFESVDGFDESLNAGEDSALAGALIAKGYKVHFAGCCAVVHLGYPRTLTEFTKRQFWHASSYLKSKKKGKADLMFIGTSLFLALLVFLPISVVFSSQMALQILIGLITLPIVLTFKRVKSAGYWTFRLDRYFKMYALDFFYLMGRSGGLAKSVLTELNILRDKKTYY